MKNCNCQYEAVRLKAILHHRELGIPSYVQLISTVGVFFMMALVIIPFKSCKETVYATPEEDEETESELERRKNKETCCRMCCRICC
jgi:hypothetical protein